MELSNRSQKKVDNILLQASRLFVQHGYHKVTMESVAQYANVSKVTLYKYFSDKQMLYEHILQMNYLQEYNEVVEVIESNLPYEEKIREVVKANIKRFSDKTVPIFEGEITLSLEIKKFMRKYKSLMISQRKKLYEQGRNEQYICTDISNEMLEIYFQIIQDGLVSNLKDLGEPEGDTFSQMLDLLYSSVLGCQN